jgi:hypothetical protein
LSMPLAGIAKKDLPDWTLRQTSLFSRGRYGRAGARPSG